jgi:hypothetical protein
VILQTVSTAYSHHENQIIWYLIGEWSGNCTPCCKKSNNKKLNTRGCTRLTLTISITSAPCIWDISHFVQSRWSSHHNHLLQIMHITLYLVTQDGLQNRSSSGM